MPGLPSQAKGVRIDIFAFVPGLLMSSQVLLPEGGRFRACAQSIAPFFQQTVETKPVRLVKEDVLAVVPV